MVLATPQPGTVPLALLFPRRLSLHDRQPLDELSRSWLAALALRGLTPATLRAYRGDIECFLAWAVPLGLRSWSEVDSDRLWAFLAKERTREIGLRLLSRRATTIRALFRFGVDEKGFSLPALHVRTKQPMRLSATVQYAEIARVIHACRGMDFFSVRDRAALEVLYGCGVTAREFCDLELDYIDFESALLRVESKYLYPRRVPINVNALDAIRAWLAVRRTVQVKGSAFALFTSANGYRLTTDGLSTLVERRSIAAGIAPPLTPRTIRNSFGVHLYEGGADDHHVAGLMGLSFRRAASLRRSANPNRLQGGRAIRAVQKDRQTL